MSPPQPSITRADLRKLARARLQDASCLFENRRYDGAVYTCGYVVELALKARICRTLKWASFETSGGLQSFKTHNLDTLLKLSGIEARVKSLHLKPWSVVITWNPEMRYLPLGTVTRQQAQQFIEAAEELVKVL